MKRHRLGQVLLSIALISGVLAVPSAQAVKSVKGSESQTLSVSTDRVSANTSVRVTGKGFDETVGIYLAYCVLPAQGMQPTPCGGGVNKAGVGNSSAWISSNAPPYAVGIAESFLPGGRFSKTVRVTKKIGKFDCTKIKCAITVRSDHLHEGDRTHDLFIPITFKK